MKAGKNTPQSVLSYIDAVMGQDIPPDPVELARELGYKPKRYRVLCEKHGDGLVAHLLIERRRRAEIPRFPAKQNGLLHPPQYVSSVHGAIDDAEAVPSDYDNVLVTKAKERFMEHRRSAHAAEEAAKDIEAVKTEMRELVKRAVKMGVDPSTVIAPIAREIQAQHAQLRKVA